MLVGTAASDGEEPGRVRYSHDVSGIQFSRGFRRPISPAERDVLGRQDMLDGGVEPGDGQPPRGDGRRQRLVIMSFVVTPAVTLSNSTMSARASIEWAAACGTL